MSDDQSQPTAPFHAAGSALASALWIAICAAAPELIWRGMKIALAHPSWADLVSALLIGSVVAFFVEPILEYLRDFLEWSRTGGLTGRRKLGVLFRATVSMVFALTSVAIHDAMIALMSGTGPDSPAHDAALLDVAELTAEWAIVPFAVALAWESARNKWLAAPIGVLGVLSTPIAGWLFDWSRSSVIATLIPCAIIQCLGYGWFGSLPRRRWFASRAAIVAGVAVVWLVVAVAIESVLAAIHAPLPRLYDVPRLLIDIRFYAGWAVGVLLAASAHEREQASHRASST